MRDISVFRFSSVDELRSHAGLWDDLWRQSDVTQPTARAELVAQWIERLGSGGTFQALVLAQRGQFVAALPLLSRRRRVLMDSLDLPGDEWSSAGDLLLATSCPAAQVCDRLISELGQLDRSLFWFQAARIDGPAWQHLIQAAGRAGWDVDSHDRFHYGWMPVQASNGVRRDQRSKNFRKKLRRGRRQLSELGSLRLRIERPTSEEAARQWLIKGLRIEHAGWKGRAGTSVLSHRKILGFYEAQASHLSKWRQVAFAFLELDQQPIAYEYAWWAKRVHHSMKIAYDERFAKYSPGQLLTQELLSHFRTSQECHTMDLIGPLDAAARRWHPGSQRVSRLLLAPPRSLGRAVVFASRNVLPAWHRWRNRQPASGGVT